MENKRGFIMRNGTCVGMDVQRVYASTPIGIIQPFASDTNIPRGYLLCNGASYKVADYPDLYAVIGNTYGGDTENFNVPDYRETVLVGVGENTTDTIASHDVYKLGEFKDDQLQRITGDFESGNRNTQPHTSGAFSIKESPYTWFALSETATSSSSVEFDSSKVTRSGTTTHGKQKGVTYIIKAFHTNEGVDSGVSDDVINYVDGEITKVDTELNTNVTALSDRVKTVEDAYAKKTEIPTTLPANGGNADTVNNHTVKSDVPENAVFTDTIYDDTELNAKLNGKADKNAVLKSLEIVNGNMAAQIIPWNDGTHYRSIDGNNGNDYTDIITKDGTAHLVKVKNGSAVKDEELATMDKVADSIIRESRSVLYNLNNVDNIEVAIDIAKSGYKPIAVSLFNSGTHLWFAQGMYFNDTVCNLSLRGVTPTSATNAECKVLVTYIKTF